MSNKLFFGAAILAILATSTFAADLLASLTNGKISDNSPGVKVLSLDEAKQVKGGYVFMYVPDMTSYNLVQTHYYFVALQSADEGLKNAEYYTIASRAAMVSKDFGYNQGTAIFVQMTVPISSTSGPIRYDVRAVNSNGTLLPYGLASSAATRMLTQFKARM
nr:hypothetical protein [uncultured Campylobacter sp.]